MQITIMEQLQALIDEAYHLFKGYPMGGAMAVCHGCGCCLQESDVKLLQSTAIKKVDRRLIYEYLDAAVADDDLLIRQMKHLLPRVLELLVQGEYLRHSTEIILDKCHCDRAEYWPAKEIDFLQRFALVYLQWVCESNGQDITLDEVVLMFHIAGLDIQPLQMKWQVLFIKPKALRDALNIVIYHTSKGRYSNAFADHAVSVAISDWFAKPEVKAILVEYILDDQQASKRSEEEQWLYELAFDYLT